ncbi:uncharacterized protein LOC129330421 [Eublepharis macularius]|uniref:Uncharacterized protein LOC129330421 n=1 Tax=Eublepharis macularius TaxID=481883 RepID=A0AA97JDB0_EUBMA|nr:uncharacterized protein LOC129330421 [Eublepharis macularius]
MTGLPAWPSGEIPEVHHGRKWCKKKGQTSHYSSYHLLYIASGTDTNKKRGQRRRQCLRSECLNCIYLYQIPVFFKQITFKTYQFSENDTTGANAVEDDDSDSDLPLGHRSRYNTADGADNRCLAEVSPGTRLFQLRNRRRRNAALYGVADDMMRRSREEHNVQVSQWRTDREMLCSWKADENKIQREFLDHTKMESEKFAEAWKQNISVMSDAVNTLKSLGQMLAQQRQIIPPTHDYGQTALPASQATPKKAAARRSCVGKARERLTL